MGAIIFATQADAGHPFIDEPSKLARAEMVCMVGPARIPAPQAGLAGKPGRLFRSRPANVELSPVKHVGTLSLFALFLAGTAATAIGQAPSSASATTDPDADARWARLQAERAAQETQAREAQERYEQGVREAAEARARYEADMARHNQEVDAARAAAADYQRQRADYEAATGDRRSATRGEPRAEDHEERRDADGGRTCEQQNRRNRGRGRAIGGILGGIAGAAGGRRLGTLGRVLAVPVGVLIGDAIARLLDCREQEQAAAATETAVTQAMEAGAERGVGTTVPWTSETRPGVTGSSTVTALDQEPGGAQCMTVTDIVIVDGEETRAPKRMCRRPPSQRFVRV